MAPAVPWHVIGEPTTDTEPGKVMSSIEQSIVVDVPVRTAYDQWTQFEQFPEFMEHVEHVRQLDPTSLRWQVSIGDADRTFDARVTEQTPDQRIAWESQEGPHHAGVVTFHYLDDERTKVMLQMDVEPSGFIEKVGDFVGAYSASVKGDLERFKKQIEERGRATGSWRGTITRDGRITHPDGSTETLTGPTGSSGGAGTAGTTGATGSDGDGATVGSHAEDGGQLASTDDTVTRDEAPAFGADSDLRKHDLRRNS